MIEIKLEEASTLTLEMQIEGDLKSSKPEMRFSVLSKGVRMSFLGEQVSKGVYEVSFPTMLGRLPEGEYIAEVEIIVDGKHFAPLTETIRFTKEIKPSVTLKENIEQAVKPKIRVGAVKKKIENVRDLMAHMSAGEEIDTAFALRCLDSLASHRPLTEGQIHVAPVADMKEVEAIVALRLISQLGIDISPSDLVCENLMGVSPKVKSELRSVLAEKGISARTLAQRGM